MTPDDELKKMERYLSEIFTQAGKDLTQKAENLMQDFAEEDAVMQQRVKSGDMKKDEYKEWRKSQLIQDEHLKKLIKLMQTELANCNQTALSYVNDKSVKIFADSYNSIDTVIKQSPVEGYSFELVDSNVIKNLATQEGVILPPKKNLDVEKDKVWNAKQVNAQLLQGILQGEAIPDIAARMAKVCESNEKASIRNARTMVTAAENSGRQSGMNKAEADGIIFKKMWIATSDERTRETHMVLNGQLVDNGENFVTINGDELEFPGDWRAPACEVYNCRCTLGTIVIGFNKIKLEEAVEKQETPEEQTEETAPIEYISMLAEDIRNAAQNFEGFSEEELQTIINSISNCPEHIANVIMQTLPNARVIVSDTNHHGGTCYSPTENIIYVLRENINSPDFAEAFWHEYFHYIDIAQNSKSPYKQVDIFRKRVWLRDENGEVVYIDGKPQKTEETESYTREGITAKLARGGDYNARYQQAVVNDMNNLLNKLGLSEYYEMRVGIDEYSDQMLWNRQTNEIIDTTCMAPEDLKRLYGSMKDYMNEVTGVNAARNYIYDLGYPKFPKREDYLEGYYTPKKHQYKEKEKYKGAEDDYRNAKLEAYRKQDEWEKSHDMEAIEAEIKRLEHEATVKSKLYGFATDSLDGAVNGALVSENLPGGGHSAVYYMFNNNAIREEIANVGAAEVTQNSEVINAMKSEMPELYKLLKEVIKDVN